MARILVVDDETNIRKMVRLALQQVGHTVEVASDGEQAMDLFGAGDAWDLVLLDQRMPGPQGIDVLRHMRRQYPPVRVIMITAFGTVDLAVEAMRAGATDFLRKPFTSDTLRGAVATALGPEPEEPTAEDAGVTFGLTTLNGFRIESAAAASPMAGNELRHSFTIRTPTGETRACEVVLPLYVVELVKTHADREQMPGGDRFWQALCEEVVANYIWQNSDTPAEGVITVDDIGQGLRRWIDSVLSPDAA